MLPPLRQQPTFGVVWELPCQEGAPTGVSQVQQALPWGVLPCRLHTPLFHGSAKLLLSTFPSP